MAGEDSLVRVEARFKNARLYSAIYDASVLTKEDYNNIWAAGGRMASFCRAHGLRYDNVTALVTLRSSPYKTAGGRGLGALRLTSTALRLCEVLNIDSDELFPPDLYKIKWPRGIAVEVPVVKLVGLSEAGSVLRLPAHQEEAMMRPDIRAIVMEGLSTLSQREQGVLTQLFGLDGEGERTGREVADALKMSEMNVSRVKRMALRKLRHPGRSRRLRVLLDPI